MYVLKDLWRGHISPRERYVCSNSEYQRVSYKLCEELDLFMENLTIEQREQYEKLEGLQFELMNISEEDTFIVGFRLGARMVLDVVGEYRGQFKSQVEL